MNKNRNDYGKYLVMASRISDITQVLKGAWMLCLFGLVALCSYPVFADYRDTPEGKLDAALRYANAFLKEDARSDQLFFVREPRFPTWKDQPIIDCGTIAIMRGIRSDTPYFEDKKQTVVVVPVWVELFMLEVPELSGFPYSKNESGQVQCRFEYEPYWSVTKRFERLPDFLTRPLHERFLTWGAPYPETDPKYGPTWIAIDLDKRYVRFRFRISVARDAPYQLYPQFPRHHPVMAAIRLFDTSAQETERKIALSISDRNPDATGQELQKDLERMRYQLKRRQWAAQQLRERVQQLQNITPFSDLQIQ